MSTKGKDIRLLIIDPQIDFMDSPGSQLPVPGANDDMNRLARLIDRIGGKLSDIIVTLDSHHIIDIAHPGMWENDKGQQPPPFTIITADDIQAGIWRPRNQHSRPPELGGQTLGNYALAYAQALLAGGKYPLMIWPEHCIIGTPGHNIQPELMKSLTAWERRYFATVTQVTKGTNPFTEHYGGLMAEVPMASDPSTGLNTNLIRTLAEADLVPIGGEALSHCEMATINQIADNIGPEHIGKFVILTDCSSPVPQPPGGPDFPAISQNWLKDMERRGMQVMKSTEFLA